MPGQKLAFFSTVFFFLLLFLEKADFFNSEAKARFDRDYVEIQPEGLELCLYSDC